MNDSRIVFITNGGVEMGMGHVYRTLGVAKEIFPVADIVFITNRDDIVINLVRKSGFTVFGADTYDELKEKLMILKPEVIIFDQRNVEEKLARELRDINNSKLVFFENHTSANNLASIVVTFVINTNFKNTKRLDQNTGTTYFIGPKYWILRDEFYDYKKKQKPLSHKIEKITMVFGASDPSNMSTKVLNELLKLNRHYQIDLCLGIHFMYFDELNEMLKQYPAERNKINSHINPQNVAQLMFESDLVITSPGTCACEALAVRTPIIAVSQNSGQDEAFKGYLDMINESRLTEIKNIIDKADYISPDQPEIIAAEIGEGKKEVVQAIINLIPLNHS